MTEQRLQEIDKRAERLLEYGPPDDGRHYAMSELAQLMADLADDDIPWLIAHARRLKAQAELGVAMIDAAVRVIANARQIRYPSRPEGRRIYGDLPYFEERGWFVEDSDFECLRIVALAAREER